MPTLMLPCFQLEKPTQTLRLHVGKHDRELPRTQHKQYTVCLEPEKTCGFSAVTTYDYAQGGLGISGVSISLDTVFHNPLEVGAKLRYGGGWRDDVVPLRGPSPRSHGPLLPGAGIYCQD
ncbi:hypothetical protein B0H19DRAFT_1080662 [Mycena capillaripes]|nr:hypothetical protein B0H19DRAFT_1080662 [Mycena capillaripes]